MSNLSMFLFFFSRNKYHFAPLPYPINLISTLTNLDHEIMNKDIKVITFPSYDTTMTGRPMPLLKVIFRTRIYSIHSESLEN